jgi:hypothetical protein
LDTDCARQLRADLVHALIEKGLLPSADASSGPRWDLAGGADGIWWRPPPLAVATHDS